LFKFETEQSKAAHSAKRTYSHKKQKNMSRSKNKFSWASVEYAIKDRFRQRRWEVPLKAVYSTSCDTPLFVTLFEQSLVMQK
jgi:hypothetical protein